MPVTTYYSNRLEDLVGELRKTISTPWPGKEIFISDYIITQTKGMSQWLSAEIARKENNGVFANFKLLNQDAFLHELHTLVTGTGAQFNQETTRWMIFEILGSDDFRQVEGFHQVAEYYHNDDLKRIQLASRLADLFDQYQIYRDTIIQNWNSDAPASDETDEEKWQKWIWRKLNGSKKFLPKNKIRDEILSALNDKEKSAKVKYKYPVVNFFGNAIYTSYHLGIYEKLSSGAGIQINHFAVFPVQEVIGEKDCRNELLISYGKKYFEMAEMLGSGKLVQGADKPSSTTLLGTVQNCIHKNIPLSASAKVSDALMTDGTVQVNSAYTKAREVEILYNYLVGLIDKTSDLGPEEILILATDINLYTPYIKAVFDNAVYKIPYKISGASSGQRESVISAVTGILGLEEDDFTSENVISLFETRAIAKKFGITGTSDIRAVIKKANIRFGIEGRKEDDTQYVSWRYGLKKLIFGYGMLTDNPYTLPGDDSSFYPFEDTEGSKGHEILRLKAFTEMLWEILIAKKEKRTLEGWRKFIAEEVFEKMVYADHEDKADTAFLFRQMNRQIEAESLITGMIDFRVFYDGLKTALSDESGEFGFNSGMLTFSSLIPARGITFRVIGFIGINNDVFPRKDKFVSYDLIPAQKFPGDRSKKENDKLLFLDTVLSAREYLYLSYIGRSAKDNSVQPPSIVLDELLDYLENLAQNPAFVRSELMVEHPLHGFSSRYKPCEARLFSYLYGTKPANEDRFLKMRDANDNDDQAAISEIKLMDLINFYKSPVRWFYQKSLGLSFGEQEDHLEENERCELNNLESWKLKNELLEVDSGDKDLIEKIRDKYMKNGDFPLCSFSRIEMSKILEQVQPVKNQKEQLTGGKIPENIGAILKLGEDLSVTGSLNDIYGNELIAHSFSKNPLKYKIETWIKYIFMRASGNDLTVRFIYCDGTAETFNQITTQAEAGNHLQKLADYFKRGTSEMILLTPRSAGEFKTNNDVNEAYKIIQFEAKYDKNKNQSPDKYLQKAIADGQFRDLTAFNEYLEELTPILINF